MSVKMWVKMSHALGTTSCLDAGSVCEVVIYGKVVIVRGASSCYKIFQSTIYGEHISSFQIQNQRRYCSVLFKEGCYLIIQIFKYSIKI